MSNAPFTIRLATAADLPAINDIYNHYVATSTCTYQEAPETPADRAAWFAAHDDAHPVTVAEAGAQILGWGALSRFHERSGYRFTVENTVYIRDGHRGKKIGSAILLDLISRARTANHRSIIAGIDADQPASIALHERHGFIRRGHLPRVGLKFNRPLDVLYYQLLL